MVVSPDRLELAELELEAAVVRLRLGLAGHALGMDVLEQITLVIFKLPIHVSKAFVIQKIKTLLFKTRQLHLRRYRVPAGSRLRGNGDLLPVCFWDVKVTVLEPVHQIILGRLHDRSRF